MEKVGCLKKIIVFIKDNKDFIITIYKNFRGPVKLRAFKIWLGFLAALAAGWGYALYIDNSGNWNFSISFSAVGWTELGLAFISLIGLYILLWFDNKEYYPNCHSNLGESLTKVDESLNQIGYNQFIASINPFITFEIFQKTYNTHNVKDLVDCESFRTKRNVIANSSEHVRVLALSGTGKTYQILRAFEESSKIDNVYYCESVLHSNFKLALQNLAIAKEGCTIILDNCPRRVCEDVIQEFGNKFRVVSAYYDPLDKTEGKISQTLSFDDVDISQILQGIISDNMIGQMPEEQRSFILYHSGGIPLIALMLTQAYNEHGYYSNIHDNTLMEHLLDIKDENKSEQRTIMRTLSLFQPIEYDDSKSLQVDFLVNSDKFTPIVQTINRKLLLKKVVEKLKARTLIEQDSIFINLRPQPLACWLVAEWIHENDMVEALNELSSMPTEIRVPLMEAMAKRLSFMQKNKDAEDLFAELVKVHGGPFCNEDVVCSDLGSRLILAMSTVNPVAIVECLYTVLYPMAVKDLSIKLKGKARRNVVISLEKLCFCKDSFSKAAMVMARLALAENEDWGNNSKGLFLQLFHVAAAGTECDLNERIKVIKTLILESEDYRLLLLKAIKGAFSYDTVSRMGGAENFGFVTLRDYTPLWSEVYEYWNSLCEILLTWINEEPIFIHEIADIICSNARSLIHAGKSELLFVLVGKIAEKKKNDWAEMHKCLIEIKNYESLKPETLKTLELWIENLTPKDVLGRMKDAVHELYAQVGAVDDILNKEEEVVLPYVKEFIANKEHLTSSIYQLLDSNAGYVSWAFNRDVAELMPKEDIESFCSNITTYIFQKDKSFCSSFLSNVFGIIPFKDLLKPCIDEFYQKGYYDLAVSLYAVTDDSAHGNLTMLIADVNNGSLEIGYIRRYLSNIRYSNIVDIFEMASFLKREINDAQLLFDHISHYWYLDECFANKELVALYKASILDYPLDAKENYNNDFTRLVEKVLKRTKDLNFAKALNEKLIGYLTAHHSVYRIEELYNTLLTEPFREVVWAEFSAALADIDKRPSLWLNLRYSIGSGFNFGEKVLFRGHIDDMKLFCRDYKYGPLICASTCPVFNFIEDWETTKEFHPFVIWLVQNYGSDEEVLDELHANMGTFTWTGSPIPLYECRKRCLENLRTYDLPKNVYEWIQLALDNNRNEYEREERNEAYRRLAYGTRE